MTAPPTAALLRQALMEQEESIAQAGALTPDMARLRATQERWRQFPGSRPGGTGRTGLKSHDARGWTAMQNDNIEGLRAMSDTPLQVRGDYRGTDFANQSFSLGGGMDAHQEQRARLLEALLSNIGSPESRQSLSSVRNMKGRW